MAYLCEKTSKTPVELLKGNTYRQLKSLSRGFLKLESLRNSALKKEAGTRKNTRIQGREPIQRNKKKEEKTMETTGNLKKGQSVGEFIKGFQAAGYEVKIT